MSTPQTNSTTANTSESPERTRTLNEQEIQRSIIQPSEDSNDFVMELDEEEWDKRPRRFTLSVPTPARVSSVIEEKKSDSSIPGIIGEKEEEHMEDYFIQPKPSNPMISSIALKLPVAEPEKFGLKNWGNLQELLKQNMHVVTNEFETKERLVKELKDAMAEHAKLQLSIREKNDIMHKKRHPEQHQDGDMTKFLSLDLSQRLGSATSYVKDLLYLIYDNPKIIAMVSKNNENTSALKTLEDSLALSFFENIIEDDEAENDVLRFYAAMLQVELNDAQKHKDLLHPDLFFNRMWAAYLRRNECKAYIKAMLGDPLLGCIKERTKIKLDINDVKKDVEKKRMKLQKTQSFIRSEKSEKDDKGRVSKKDAEEYFTLETLESSAFRRLMKQQNDEEISGVPRFRGKTERTIYRTEMFEERKSVDKKSLETPNGDNNSSPLKGLPDREVAHNLERNFGILKKHLSVLVQSIFNNLDNMPTRLRALCKVTHYLTRKKFPNLSDKESYEILINNLFRRWIFPKSVDTSILDHFEPSADLAHNLEEIPKALKKIFDLELYPENDIRSELNEYFKEIMPSIQRYFKELVSVNEEALQEILVSKPPKAVTIKSKSVCLSLYEIKLLSECIIRHRFGLSGEYPNAVSLAEKIMRYDQSDNIFSFGINPTTGQAIKSSQMFLLFHDIIFPQHLNPDYLAEFSKSNKMPKHLSDEEKMINRTKYCLKNFLIGTKSIKSSTRWTLESNATLESALEQFSNKSYCDEINPAKRNDKGQQVQISARFVSACLSELPENYKANNYYKLHQEIIEDLKSQTESLDTNLSSIKLQLFDGKEILESKIERLAEVDKERGKALKRDNIWDFIKSLRIPVCITSPSTMGSMLKEAYKSNANKSKVLSDKIEVHLRGNKGCIHDQFSIMRELTISAGAIAIGSMKPMGGSKSMASASSSSSSVSGFDDMSCHLETVDKFISFFGGLKEVKQAIVEGIDEHGVNDAIVFLYEKIKEEIPKKYPSITDDEITDITDEVENYICKRLYYYAFPSRETEADRKFSRKCKVLEWVTCEQLEIAPSNRHTQLWQYNSDTLNQINNRITPAEKLQCMQECLRIISQVLDLAELGQSSVGAEETLPILVNCILRACPKRIHSNLNFIEMFMDPKRMLGLDGYCFTQTKSAVMVLQEADHNFFKMDPEKFLELINAKEIEFGFTVTK